MLRKTLLSFCASIAGFVSAAQADSTVVVELYTSQGCSSCPPADRLLSELAQQENVIALGLHVDYWDYLGWQDKFAIAKFTKRQEVYNMTLPSRYRLVTPQMVIHGSAQVAGGTGASPGLVKKYVEDMAAIEEPAQLNLAREGDVLRIEISPGPKPLAPANVQLIRYLPKQVIEVKRGENRGRELEYSNVVMGWDVIAKWDGETQMTLEHAAPADGALAVIVQKAKLGPVYVARALR